MLTVAEIRDQLFTDNTVRSDEGIDEVTGDRFIQEAIVEHNSAYLSDGSNLPEREVSLVKLLAGVKLNHLRAAKWATQNSLSSNTGYGQDRDTPFAKLTRLAVLQFEQYKTKCEQIGISPGGNDPASSVSTVVQGSLTAVDYDIEMRTPMRNDKTKLQTVTLKSINTIGQTEVDLFWTKSLDETFSYYILLYMPGANQPIYQETNWESAAGVPRINDGAVQIFNTYDPDKNSLKVTGLVANSDYTFIVAVMNRQSKWVYSNALSLKTAA